MEIRVLRYFLTVVREESITKAADVLHITQPTLSRQLSQMEDDIGVKLFHRGTRKLPLPTRECCFGEGQKKSYSLWTIRKRNWWSRRNRLKGK